MKRSFPALLMSAFLVLVCELLSWSSQLNEALFPPPHQVIIGLWEFRNDFLSALLSTASNVLAGYLASIVLGFSLALIFSFWPTLRRAILPFAIFFQTVPIIAIAPLLVIYFGFGAPTVIASSLIVSVFPILANSLLGLESIDPNEIELFQIYRATPLQMLLGLRIPRAYPAIYGGLKIAAGLSVIGAIAGEFVAGGGLGALIDSARTQQRIDLVFGALLLLSALGLALIGLLRFIHQKIQSVRPYGLELKD